MMKFRFLWSDSSDQLAYHRSSLLPMAVKKPLLATAFASVLAMVVSGCDSQSATFSVIEPAKQDSQVESAAPSESPKEVKSANDTAEIEPDTGGQSLLAAAKIDDTDLAAINNKNNDNTLHATLIGDYEGVVPCSFCESTTVTLNLLSDGSVTKISIFEAPEMPKEPTVQSGVYRQDDNKIIIVYEDKALESFEIQDNHLLMLDENKQPDADYILSRK